MRRQHVRLFESFGERARLERNSEKWKPVFRKIARQSKKLEPHSDSNVVNVASATSGRHVASRHTARLSPRAWVRRRTANGRPRVAAQDRSAWWCWFLKRCS